VSKDVALIKMKHVGSINIKTNS